MYKKLNKSEQFYRKTKENRNWCKRLVGKENSKNLDYQGIVKILIEESELNGFSPASFQVYHTDRPSDAPSSSSHDILKRTFSQYHCMNILDAKGWNVQEQ